MRPTIIDLFNITVDKFAANPFLWEKNDKEFVPTNYLETKQQVHVLAAGLLKLGVNRGDKIALLSEGRNAWIIGELSILHAGAISVPLSIKLEESNDLIFRLVHSEASIIMVSGGQLKKIRTIADAIKGIKKIIIFDEQDEYAGNEMSMIELMKLGNEFLNMHPNAVIGRSKQVKPDDVATIS